MSNFFGAGWLIGPCASGRKADTMKASAKIWSGMSAQTPKPKQWKQHKHEVPKNPGKSKKEGKGHQVEVREIGVTTPLPSRVPWSSGVSSGSCLVLTLLGSSWRFKG